jgi:hypothetical protein
MKASPALIEANRRICREQHQKSINRYYENPNFCQQCGKVIEVGENKRVSEIRQKKFCDSSCAAKFNNIGVDRWAKKQEEKIRDTKETGYTSRYSQSNCVSCSQIIFLTEVRGRPGIYRKRLFCDKCRVETVSAKVSQALRSREYRPVLQSNSLKKGGEIVRASSGTCQKCDKTFSYTETKHRPGKFYFRRFCDICLVDNQRDLLRIQKGIGYPKPVGEMTKADLLLYYEGSTFKRKTAITNHARKQFDNSGRPRECQVCDYDLVTQVAHIRSVADFPDDATVEEINHSDNLVCLCPNHHYEYDRGLVKLD